MRPRSSFLVLLLVLVVAAGCAKSPHLRVAPDQAEFPFGRPIDVNGEVEAGEWTSARDLQVDLPDGRRVTIGLQRDRANFYFVFAGLDVDVGLDVHPEILLDLWGNGSDRLDDDDWWFAIDRELCWARGHIGEGDLQKVDCGRIAPGWQANTLPLARDQELEVAITFDAVRFNESYDGTIGMAFRFVDASGTQVAIWPLRADPRRPSSWAPISLRH